eukprot:2466448-Prymnesium_polylepis.1
MSGGRSRRHHRARWPGRWLGAPWEGPHPELPENPRDQGCSVLLVRAVSQHSTHARAAHNRPPAHTCAATRVARSAPPHQHPQ